MRCTILCRRAAVVLGEKTVEGGYRTEAAGVTYGFDLVLCSEEQMGGMLKALLCDVGSECAARIFLQVLQYVHHRHIHIPDNVLARQLLCKEPVVGQQYLVELRYEGITLGSLSTIVLRLLIIYLVLLQVCAKVVERQAVLQILWLCIACKSEQIVD